jgi:hypothetical protein
LRRSLVGLIVFPSLPHRGFSSSGRFRATKKAPEGACSFAHGWISPGGYAALPMRVPTRMTIVFFMGADNDAMNFGCQWEIDRPWLTLQPPK